MAPRVVASAWRLALQVQDRVAPSPSALALLLLGRADQSLWVLARAAVAWAAVCRWVQVRALRAAEARCPWQAAAAALLVVQSACVVAQAVLAKAAQSCSQVVLEVPAARAALFRLAHQTAARVALYL